MFRSNDKLDYWADFLRQGFAPFRVEPAGDLPFHAEMDVRRAGDLLVVSVSACGCHVALTPAEIARARAGVYSVAIEVDGDTPLMTRGEERLLTPGDVFIVDSMHAYEFNFEQPFRHLFVNIPKAWIDARMPHPERLAGSVLPHDRPLARMLAGYLAAGFQTMEELPPAVVALYGQHLADLVAEAFAEPPGKPLPPEAWRAAMFARACRVIALKFGDPSLRPERIAKALGMSTRTLNRVFAAHGTTVTRRVLEQRLDRAAKLLASPESYGRTITEIAFACGFSDVSHFGRVFAERLRATPSEWRKQHL
ncbi:MAG: helix-turn-helix domain-containing protein [Methyloceanibacter sp.]|uniref:helix-turn-helix domain-containing protein n=1 Tax=Methyloceanibacter sp. TaxID=1965321 RepID=UPI003D6CCE7B